MSWLKKRLDELFVDKEVRPSPGSRRAGPDP